MPFSSRQIKTLNKVFLLTLLCVFSLYASAQNDSWDIAKYKFSAPLTHAVADSLKQQEASWEEVIDKRTEYSSTFKTQDGRIISKSGKAKLNYYDAAGALQPIDATLSTTGNGWAAMQQEFPTYLNTNGSSAITLNGNQQILFNQNSKINGKSIATSNATFKGEGIHWKSVAPGIDKMIFFRENLIETDYVLLNPIKTNNPYLIISEEVVLPTGYKLQPDQNRGSTENDLWKGDLVITSAEGQIEARFRVPVFIDATGTRTVGSYKLTRKKGKTLLETHVPTAWLNHEDRKYPVIIDPLVTGPTASFGASTIPSCFDPNEGVDSILVTIPAEITILGVYVQSSYYADPLAGAVMGEGNMRFSTICGSSPDLTITGAQANTSGTAFLDFFNYRNTVGCCFVPQCIQQQFYLRMHIKRTAGGPGCNDTYIYYDPTSQWPFQCYVEGRTIETVVNQWSVSPTQLCSDQCELTLDFTARYGVPPYTFTHPWASGPYSFGTPNPCSIHTAFQDTTVTIPNCPTFCGNTSNLTVPVPTITDACGNTISGWNPIDITVDPTPEITATPSQVVVCSGDPVDIVFESCGGANTVDWTASDGSSGTDIVSSNPINIGATIDTITYTTTVNGANGCDAPPITVDVIVNPYPIANAGNDVTIGYGESTTLTGSGGTTYSWDPSSTLDADNIANPTASPLETTTYTVTVSNNGCTSTDEVTVVVEQIIEVPNTFTPNGDGVNDTWEIHNLHRYPDAKLTVYTRWGQKVFNTVGYTTNWDGTNKNKFLPSSTYYYVLDLNNPNIPKEYRIIAGSITIIY
jgi:gliding motility-associated-like protein